LIVQSGNRLGWHALYSWTPSANKKPETEFTIRVLPRTKTIRGTLVDNQGRPLARVPVNVQYLDGVPYYILEGKNPLWNSGGE
jgi:hypothetical protein